MSSNDTSTTSSSYNFYVEITDGAPLMLGQHVFMEPDLGQTKVKEGLWLSAFYLVIDGNDAYVWAAGKMTGWKNGRSRPENTMKRWMNMKSLPA